MNTQHQSESIAKSPNGESRSLRRSKLDALAPFHDKIVAWRQQEMDLRAIAAHLNAQGCTVTVDHNVVARYLAKHSIPNGHTHPVPADTPRSEQTHVEPAPIQAPTDILGPSSEPAVIVGSLRDAAPVDSSDNQSLSIETLPPAPKPPSAPSLMLARLHLADLANLSQTAYAERVEPQAQHGDLFGEQE